LLLLRLVLAAAAMSKIYRFSSPPLSPALIDLFEETKEAIGVKGNVDLRIVEGFAPPISVGIFRRTIFLPRFLIQEPGPEQLRPILFHELAHIRWRDYTVNLVQRLAEAIFFFHPLVHLMSRHLRNLREEICDNWALRHFRDATAYAKLVTTVAERAILPGKGLVGVGLLYHWDSLAGRMKRILSSARPSSGALRLRTALLLVAASLLAVGALFRTSVSFGRRAAKGTDLSEDRQGLISAHIRSMGPAISWKGHAIQWIITIPRDPVRGRAIYRVSSDGSTVAPLYAPSGLPQGGWIACPEIDDRGRVVFHVSSDYASFEHGPLYWGKIGTDEIYPLARAYRDSPVGRVFWIPGKDEVLFSNYWSGIHRMDLDPDTDDETVITDNYFDEITGIARNGTVFFENSLYRSPDDMWTMNLDGTNIRGFDPLGDHETRAGEISPDEKHVVVFHERDPGMWIATTAGGLVTPLAEPLVSFQYHSHAWAPDSKRIAFVNDDGSAWSINIDGTGLRQITHGVLDFHRAAKTP